MYQIDAALELADIDLTRLQIGAARLEDAPALVPETTSQQPQERRLSDQRFATDQQRTRRALADRRFGERERALPTVRLDQNVGAGFVRPETAHRGQDGDLLRDIGRMNGRSIELLAQGLGERVSNHGQKAPDDGVRRSVRRGPQRRSEGRNVAALRASREIIAKNIRHPAAFDPPVLGADERRADRNMRCDVEQEVEREIHGPRREVLALRQHALDRLGPILALLEGRQRGAGKRPAIAFDILQDDGERNAGSGKQSGRLDKVRVRAQCARMRGVRAEGAEHLVEFVKPGRQNRRLGAAGRHGQRFQLAAYPPRAQLCAEDKRKHRGGQDHVEQNDDVVHVSRPPPGCALLSPAK
jgi:hypothetical protein